MARAKIAHIGTGDHEHQVAVPNLFVRIGVEASVQTNSSFLRIRMLSGKFVRTSFNRAMPVIEDDDFSDIRMPTGKALDDRACLFETLNTLESLAMTPS